MKPNDDQSSEPNESGKKPDPPRKGEYIITAKDAGWRRPGLFVAPATFVTIDPPEPKKRRPPA